MSLTAEVSLLPALPSLLEGIVIVKKNPDYVKPENFGQSPKKSKDVTCGPPLPPRSLVYACVD